MSNESSIPKFLSVALWILALSGGLVSTGRAAQNAPAPTTPASEAWTGVITYTRTQTQSDHKTIDRVSGRGKDMRNWEMNFNYKAAVGIAQDPANKGETIAKASITHTFTSKESSVAVEKNSCDRGKTWQDMTGTFTSETKISGQGKADADVNIGLNSDGTYSISVGVPEIMGTVIGSETSAFSGQCTPKEGKNRSLPSMPISIQGHSLTSDGTSRVDPNEPNQLSGSYSLTLPGGVVESISWNLQRNAKPLRIIDLKFEEMKFPTWNDWHEISEQTGTIDGNLVKIKATVFNASADTKSGELTLKETYKGDKWDGAKPDAALKDAVFSFTLAGGEQHEVELVWDGSGYAWYDDGRPRMVQRMKAELAENSRKVDEKVQNLKVLPKPLVMIAGIWTDPNAFEVYQNILTTTHSYGWKSYTVKDMSSQDVIADESTPKVVASNHSVHENADNLKTYVNAVRGSHNAWHIDLLGHGTGGLVGRLYVQKQDMVPDGRPVVKHLLLMGTPNNGIDCAEILAALFASDENKAMAKQLAPEEMANFNKYVTQLNGTKVSALAGKLSPNLCGPPAWSDGRVTVESAKYGVEDVTITESLHGDLLSTVNYNDYVAPHVITGPQGTYPRAKAAKN